MLYITKSLLFAITASVLMTGMGWAEEEKEDKLTAGQLPAAVKATLEKAAKGAVLSDFEREVKKGVTVYTAEIPGAEKGTVIEFTVAEDGTLLKQETEKDGDHDEGNGKHEHEHEHKDK